MTETQIVATGVFQIGHDSSIESMLLETGSGSDEVRILQSPAADFFRVDTGSGVDTVNVGGGSLDDITREVNVELGGAASRLIVDDAQDPSPHTYVFGLGSGGSVVRRDDIDRDHPITLVHESAAGARLEVRGGPGGDAYIANEVIDPLTVDAGGGDDGTRPAATTPISPASP